MTKMEVKKTEKVNKLSEQMLALQQLREKQRQMEMDKRKQTIRNETDNINNVSLEHHRRIKNSQIIQKF